MTMLLALVSLLAEPAEQPPLVGDFVLKDAQGKKHTRGDWKEKKAVVLLFLAPDCPVSNFYCPEYARLARLYADKGVLVYGVHPDPAVTAADAAQHAAQYRLPFPVLLDPTHVLARPAGVTVTPEAVLLAPTGDVLYRGRIDDRYNAQGVRREVATTRDLQDALQAVLDGKKPPVFETKAFGCPLPDPAPSGKE